MSLAASTLSDGYSATPTVTSVQLRLLRLTMVEQLAADHGTTSYRELAVVGLGYRTNSGHHDETGQYWGWGECAALTTSGYTAASAAEAFDLLEVLGPDLLGQRLSKILAWCHQGDAGPLASAAVEMAALDAIGKARGQSLATMAGVGANDAKGHINVAAGATIGIGNLDELTTTARQLVVDGGYRRIKLKIQPGHDLDVVTTVFSELTNPPADNWPTAQSAIQWQVDANGSYTHDDVELLVRLAEAGVMAIEQPFAPDDDHSAVTLIAELERRGLHCLVVADESVADATSIEQLASVGAATAITIKPFRFGGLAGAMAAIDVCRQLGLVTSIGGMIESGLGRRSLAPIAAYASTDLIGDLSPSGRWLSQDPWPDLPTSVTESTGLTVAVPPVPGVAPPPDQALLDAVTVRHQTFD